MNEQQITTRGDVIALRDKNDGRYRVNEVFYSIQGEGPRAGVSSVFVRFSHCNLQCTWCDTKYDTGDWLTANELYAKIQEVLAEVAVDAPLRPAPDVVFTGGEPTLWLDERLIKPLHEYHVLTCETNGVVWNEALRFLDLVVISPKTPGGWWSSVAELPLWKKAIKVVFDPSNPNLPQIMEAAKHWTTRDKLFLQPLEDQDTKETNAADVVAYCKANPAWRVSLQTHKVLKVR